MKVTEKQIAAVQFISRNPGASVVEIAAAAGASTSGSNDAEFLRRLIDGGLVQVVPTADVRAVLDGDADDYIDEAAAALHDAIRGD
ncbi:MAG: hypothetical protein ACXVXP_00245 [Mycobacteriaceae bacterium]